MMDSRCTTFVVDTEEISNINVSPILKLNQPLGDSFYKDTTLSKSRETEIWSVPTNPSDEKTIVKEEEFNLEDHSYACNEESAIVDSEHSYAKCDDQDIIDMYKQLGAYSPLEVVHTTPTNVTTETSVDIDVNDETHISNEVEVQIADHDSEIKPELVEGGSSNEPDEDNPFRSTSPACIDKNERRTLEDLGEKSTWQIDLKVLLEETYLKEQGFPVSNDLPLKPPRSTAPNSDCTDSDTSDNTSEEIEIPLRDSNNTYKCVTCNYQTTERSNIRKHLHNHIGERLFKCSKCSYRTAYEWHLKEHYKVHTGEKLYKCCLCTFASGQKFNLIKHLKSHADAVRNKRAVVEKSRDGLYHCAGCGFATSKQSVMENHMIDTSHTNLTLHKSFRCASCGHTTNTKNALMIHMQSHTSKKPYKCIKCGYSAATSAEVDLHMKAHTSEIPYKCTECGYTTRFTNNLLKHMERHQQHELHKCRKCNYVTASKRALILHAKVHILHCTRCRFRCVRLWQLNLHMHKHVKMSSKQKLMRIHGTTHRVRANGEKSRTFKCSDCDYSAVTNRILRQHIMRSHSKL